MKSLEEIGAIIEAARASGCLSVTIDGDTYVVGQSTPIQAPVIQYEPKLENIYKETPMLDGISDEEVLYYATPYYDEIQERKRMKQERIQEELRN